MKKFILFFCLLTPLLLRFSGCAGKWIHIEGKGLEYVTEKAADSVFINKIWEEIKKDVGIKDDLPLPDIVFSEKYINKNGYISLGFYDRNNKKIIIYSYGFSGSSITEIYIYNTIAHELLHYAIDYKWSIVRRSHCMMWSYGYLDRITAYIRDYFNDKEGLARKKSLENLERQCKKDKCF